MLEMPFLYIDIVLYDVINDIIFEEILPIQKVTMKFRNKIDNNVNDLDEIKYSGKLKNTGDDGIVLLGCI